MVCRKDPRFRKNKLPLKAFLQISGRTALLIVALAVAGSSIMSQTKVVLIPTIHGLHRINHQYSYDSLKHIVSAIQPSVIAVEIRDEDVNADTGYLKINYPYEMWMMRYWFPNTAIEGFDWLGADIEKKTIPGNYWKEISAVKQMEKQLAADSLNNAAAGLCNEYNDQRLSILKASSLSSILQSKDTLLIKAYYNCLQTRLGDTRYAAILEFYRERNQKMMERIKAVVDKHQGKTIAILTGDDHYPFLLNYLRTLNIVLLHP